MEDYAKSDSSDDSEIAVSNEGIEDENSSTSESETTMPITIKEEVTSKRSNQSNNQTTINGIPAPKLYI
ncbi:hypothetical protein JCM9152_2111 [Halalkalibacter hemicellulosilyticusJCM 9152]|uniref:Uncharacterized protein n=1 Tax=Halalkalibacter hemicellulosilyticusJCM 9152 TaxID=1236971 RepID=W4QF09_9BACI|nr:hypothetical protein JCM9152_2111 [Halalkalibacter hemicellulosilyticusJCM 9152]